MLLLFNQCAGVGLWHCGSVAMCRWVWNSPEECVRARRPAHSLNTRPPLFCTGSKTPGYGIHGLGRISIVSKLFSFCVSFV